MSDAGVPRFPEPGQYRPEAGGRRAGNNDFQIGRLDRAPEEIRAEITAQRKAVRLEGEVIRVNDDGSVRVRTERGEIDVRLSADERHQQRPPQVGQRVEVDLQPPPRNTPEQLPQVTLRPAPPEVQVQQPNVRVSETPVQVEVRDGQAAQVQRPEAQIVRPEQIDPNAPPPQNRFPEIGSLARLEPVSPQQLEQLVVNKQLVVAEIVRNSVTPLPILDVLPAPQQQPAAPVVTQVQVQSQTQPPVLQNAAIQIASNVPVPTILQPVQALEITPPQPQPTQTQQVVLPAVQPVLNNIFTQAASPTDSQIIVPILTRAQAAVAQVQSLATQPAILDTFVPPTPQDVRVGQIQPPQATLVPPTPNEAASSPIFTPPEATPQNPVIGTQKAAQVSGVVIAKTDAQVPVVQFTAAQNASAPVIAGAPPLLNAPLTPIQQQTYILQFPSDALVLGSKIDVTPQVLQASSAQAAPTPLTSALPVLPYANIAFPQPWPILQDIQQSLLQQTTQAAAQTAQAFTASIPSPANSAQFGPAALFFIAAVRGGDLGSWLGDKASEILRSHGKSSLLSRLTGDVATGRAAPDAPQGEWRGMNIPLFWGGDIQKIALHYKHDSHDGNDEQAQGNKGTRFIFDLNLDAMGKVQLDGFFRPVSSDGPRLDIVLRTEERFSGTMQAEMRRIYMDAIKPSQVGGELSFQDGFDAWVMIDVESETALGVSA